MGPVPVPPIAVRAAGARERLIRAAALVDRYRNDNARALLAAGGSARRQAAKTLGLKSAQDAIDLHAVAASLECVHQSCEHWLSKLVHHGADLLDAHNTLSTTAQSGLAQALFQARVSAAGCCGAVGWRRRL